jgi:formylglycine-generating enzyme required for sulfatase activity
MKRLTFSIILVFLLLLVSSPFAQRGFRIKIPESVRSELPEQVYRTGWALLIGINKYPNLPANYQLNYAVADAEDFGSLLQRKFGFSNIRILRDEQATKQGILDELSLFADPKKVENNDCVLVFFSGHGQTVSLPRGGEMGFLVPYDAKVNLSEQPNAAEYYRYCIGMDELKRIRTLIPAKHVIFIVDACYSGLALESSRGLDSKIPGYLKKVAIASTQQMITAGGKGEESVERSDFGHGVFTYKLLEGLDKRIADWNNDGVITGSELGTYLRNTVPEMSEQIPDSRREGEGEFLFLPQVEEKPVIIEELESTAILIVDSNPKGADVYVDERKVGETPCTVRIDAGVEGKREVTVAVSKKGYQTKRAKAKLIAGKQAKWTDIQLEKLTNATHSQEITGKDGAKMVLIPAGEFQMGDNFNEGYDDEHPVHTVYLDEFYIDTYEVTNAQYAAFLNAYGKNVDAAGHELLEINSGWCLIEKAENTYKPKSGYENHPVNEVSWYGAAAYAQFYGKRLPTEAEWEKSARGGLVGKRYPWGDESPEGRASYGGEWSLYGMKRTLKPVGSFAPNGYGLFDMAGNLWEWCTDEYDSGYYSKSPKNNPKGPGVSVTFKNNNFTNVNTRRVLRGGGWSSDPISLRCADRNNFDPAYTYDLIGFRCSQEL